MNASIEDVTVEHMMPGRVRLRFRSKRGDLPFFKELVELISRFAAVEAIDANPQTGGVLIRHSATREELLVFASLSGLLDPARFAPSDGGPAGAADRAGGPARGGRSLTGVAFVALAIIQALRGRVLGSATEQFWHGGGLMAHKHPATGLALIALGFFQLLSGQVLAPASSLLTYALISEATKALPPQEVPGLGTDNTQGGGDPPPP
jgi:hypothetical protein